MFDLLKYWIFKGIPFDTVTSDTDNSRLLSPSPDNVNGGSITFTIRYSFRSSCL